MATSQQKEAFGSALSSYLEASRFSSLTALAKAVDRTQSAVSQWVSGQTVPSPETVFALERVLGLEPGRLSHFLGYLPIDSNGPNVKGVPEAIQADRQLNEANRRLLLAIYTEMVKTQRRR